jgi:hypothetical protein
MRLPTPEYDIGSVIYLVVNAERKGMVTGYLVRAEGILTYLVTWDDPVDEKEHWACELTATKPLDLPDEQ